MPCRISLRKRWPANRNLRRQRNAEINAATTDESEPFCSRRAVCACLALFLGAGLCAVLPATAQAQQKRFQVSDSDLRKMVTVSDPQISPDDKSIAVVVRTHQHERGQHGQRACAHRHRYRRAACADFGAQACKLAALVLEWGSAWHSSPRRTKAKTQRRRFSYCPWTAATPRKSRARLMEWNNSRGGPMEQRSPT